MAAPTSARATSRASRTGFGERWTSACDWAPAKTSISCRESWSGSRAPAPSPDADPPAQAVLVAAHDLVRGMRRVGQLRRGVHERAAAELRQLHHRLELHEEAVELLARIADAASAGPVSSSKTGRSRLSYAATIRPSLLPKRSTACASRCRPPCSAHRRRSP